MLESLAKSLEKMLIQMTLQMAMQQALGAGASGLAGLMLGPQAGAGGPVASQQGAGGSAGLGGGLFGGGGSGFFAKGGVIQAPLGSGVYVHPTYFESAPLRKFAAGGHMEASLPHGVYITPTVFETKQPGVQRFARGVGLLGEAGPEAVLPLTRSSSGELGIRAKSADPIYNESILPISRLSDGVLGVRTPIQRLAAGAHIEAALPHGVYTRPTLFEMQPSGFHPFAKGTGMLGEAGPEAVLPLTRTSGGELGVRAGGGTAVSVPVNVVVNNSSSAKVFTEQHENQSGGKDIVLTIADQVEGLVASRMARSGSRVSRAVGQVGAVNAR